VTKLSRSLARLQRCRGDEVAKPPPEWRNYQNTRKSRSKARRNWKTEMAKVATRKRGERKTRSLPHCPGLFKHSDFPSIQLHELWIRLCGWLPFAQREASTFHPLIRWKYELRECTRHYEPGSLAEGKDIHLLNRWITASCLITISHQELQGQTLSRWMDECALLWFRIAFFGVKIYFYNRYWSPLL